MYEKCGILYDHDTEEETKEEKEARKYKNRYFDEFELKDQENKDKGVNYE